MESIIYSGSAYVHTAKLLSMFSSGARVDYVLEPLVLCRGDNEGLMEHGLYNRARTDFVWYARILEELFLREPARAATLRVVRRESTLARLLLLVAEAGHGEPQELLQRVRAFRYPRALRAAVGVSARVAPLRALMHRCVPPARALWWRRTRRGTDLALRTAAAPSGHDAPSCDPTT